MEGSILIDYHVHALAHGEFEYSRIGFGNFCLKLGNGKYLKLVLVNTIGSLSR